MRETALAVTGATLLFIIGCDPGAPTALDAEFSLPEDGQLVDQLQAKNPRGEKLAFEVLSGPSHGDLVLDPDSGEITYTPEEDYYGADAFDFRVSDSEDASRAATVTLIVESVLDAPTAVAASASVDEDGSVSGELEATQPETVELTFSLTHTPAHGEAVVEDDGTFTYTPEPDYFGGDSFTYVAHNGLDSNEAAVEVEVLPVNDAPTAESAHVDTLEDTSYSGTLSFGDIDDVDPYFDFEDPPMHGTVMRLDAFAGTYQYKPDTNYNGADSFTYFVTDGDEVTVEMVTVDVAPVNDRPATLNVSPLATAEDNAKNGTLKGTDVDGDALTFQISTPPGSGTVTLVNAAAGTVTYTPDANFNGSDAFYFTVSDGALTSFPRRVDVNVSPVNDAPVANAASATVSEDSSVQISLSGSDVEGSPLQFSIASAPTIGQASMVDSSGTVEYTPDPNRNGSDSFTIRAFDGALFSAPATVTVTVSSDGITPEPVQLTVTSALGMADLPIDAAVPMTATALMDDGSNADVTGVADWSSSDPDIIEVSASGLATARQCGAADVNAAYGGVQGTHAANAGMDHRIFVTSERFNGNLAASYQGRSFPNGLQGADARCQELADAAGLGRNWRAVIGDSSESARDRVQVCGEVTDMRGTPRFAGHNEMFPASSSDALIRFIMYDESGDDVTLLDPDAPTWTGSTKTGTQQFSRHCSQWSSTAALGQIGEGFDIDYGTWLSVGSRSCGSTAHLYCIEQPVPQRVELVIAPGAPTINLTGNGEQQLALHGVNDYGANDDLTAQASWSSDDPSTAYFSTTPGEEGLLIGVTSGDVTVTASYDGQSVTASAHVVDQFHRIFWSDETFTNNFTSSYGGQSFDPGSYSSEYHAAYDGMNYRCQSMAADAGLTGTWMAVQAYRPLGRGIWKVTKFAGGSSTLSAVEFAGPVVNMDGSVAWDDNAHFESDPTPTNSVRYDQYGNLTGGRAWTSDCTYDFLLDDDVAVYATPGQFLDVYPTGTRDPCEKSYHLVCAETGP